ncbi:hypothetical protein VTK73DRAFT_3282 [Phialemonium thermophilum]|uniref:Endonuclease/exonuclease/phosphatase domain-containing protein n=1 Tax=Phialemonium thermophilum TaxID=223376 RepID=A0ABR3Y8A9_9PEZI
MEDRPTEINIVSLNCWGLKYISKLRSERLTEIGRRLATADPLPHIVALQECWTQEDYRSIRRQTRFILPYGKFYFSGVFGGGLVILSKWPIEESTMYRYPLNGRPTAFFRGDWFVGKGVACAKIRYGPGPKDVVEVFNTHTHAPYEREPHDSYVCHRTAQAWEMAKLLRGAAERGHLVIGLGDFNMLPLSLAHRIISTGAPVRDVWRVLHPDSALGPAHSAAEKARRRPVPTAEFNLRENGATSDNVYNTWRWSKAQQQQLGPGKAPITVPPDTIDPRGKRLDYIFAGSGDVATLGGSWVVKRAVVGMLEPHPVWGCSVSDHFSVEATLAFHAKVGTRHVRLSGERGDNHEGMGLESVRGGRQRVSKLEVGEDGASDQSDELGSAALQSGAYLESPRTSQFGDSSELGDNPVDDQSTPDWGTLPLSSYDEILGMIHKYMARELKQRRWRGIHFFGSVGVTVISLVGVWFVPRSFVAFLLLLVSSLSLAAGTVDGLIALLFVNWELRALKEFEWEVLNAKAAAGGGRGPALDEESLGERKNGWS